MSLPPPDFPVSENQGPKPTSGLAITSLICGLLQFLCCGLGSLLAVIFGHVALGQTRRGERAGAGLAITGLVLGYLGLLGTVGVGAFVATRSLEDWAAWEVWWMRMAVDAHRQQTGELPASLDQVSNGRRVPDPWGHDLKLVKTDTGFYIVSFGPDGREGTADDIRSDK